MPSQRAMRFAYETFGVRVSEVPELFQRGDVTPDGFYYQLPGAARTCNRWRVVLESEVTLRGTTSLRTVTTDVIHVGALSCGPFDVTPYLQLPLVEQPATANMASQDVTVSPPRTWVVTIPLVAPIWFEIALRAP